MQTTTKAVTKSFSLSPRGRSGPPAAAIKAAALFILVAGTLAAREIDGTVTDQSGTAIAGALVISSGTGFNGWAETKADGSFHLKAVGLFLSVRHAKFNPKLVRTSDLAGLPRIQLDGPSDVRQLQKCSSLPDEGRAWIGGMLRVKPPNSSSDKRQNGEHDSHWYVRFGRQALHVVDGYASHSGLPLEDVLSGSQSIAVRGWVFENVVGLDMRGVSANGEHWRWLGAPISSAVEYYGADGRAAKFFDAVVETACYYPPSDRP